ncbi:hypothetical protein [Sandaracinus amylolyticus]|nr:hypothetical protein [Sandaracinus amylolyticus]
MRIRLALASLLALSIGTGCSPTVGDACDDALARTPYYDRNGSPLYSGQAYMVEQCASCHGEDAALGAPEGLNFPVGLVSGAGEQAISGGRRLLWAQANVHRQRDLIYSQVVNGAMPPRGFVPAGDSAYADADGNVLPSLRTAEGQEVLRNWLACGSPVIERTTPLAQPCTAPGECPVTNFCVLEDPDPTDEIDPRNQCLAVGDIVPAAGGGVDCEGEPQATWSWIYTCLFQADQTCTSAACHGGGAMGGALAMPDAATGYANLFEVESEPAGACMGRVRVVPGDPDASLLVHKVEMGNPMSCETPMPIGPPPLSEEEVGIIRQWITDGAMNN